MAKKKFENMMDGISHYADLEWEEWSEGAEPAAFEPKTAFVMGYIFGVGLGLALSPRLPELAKKLAKDHRQKRGWQV